MPSKIWMDNSSADIDSIGDVGFLVQICTERGAEHWELRTRPAHTNMSREPKWSGWCGTTDGTTVYAEGLGQIIEHSIQGDRIRVETIIDTDTRIDAYLNKLGWTREQIEDAPPEQNKDAP